MSPRITRIARISEKEESQEEEQEEDAEADTEWRAMNRQACKPSCFPNP
jgi:hypothetical protein